jgi:hypothetical protein
VSDPRLAHRVYGHRFHLSPDQFDALNLALIVLYKVGILLFNLAPFVALLIVG